MKLKQLKRDFYKGVITEKTEKYYNYFKKAYKEKTY